MGKKFRAKDKYESTQTSGGGGDIRRMKFEVGTSIVRIVQDNFEDAWVHYFNDKDGKNSRVVCLGKGKCPVCETGAKATHRFYFNVIDRKEQKETKKTEIKIMECGKMIYEQIRELALDEEYGDPTQYNLKITRKGEKKSTKYSVRASTKIYDLTEDEKEVSKSATEEGGSYDLTLFVGKQTKAEILERLGTEEEEIEEENNDEDEENTNDSKPSKKNKISNNDKENEDEDEEELDIDKELEELEEDDDDDEEEEKPKKKANNEKKVSKKDEDDEEEDW